MLGFDTSALTSDSQNPMRNTFCRLWINRAAVLCWNIPARSCFGWGLRGDIKDEAEMTNGASENLEMDSKQRGTLGKCSWKLEKWNPWFERKRPDCFICHVDTTWDLLGENSTEELSRSGFLRGVVFIVPWCRKTTPPWAGQFPKQGFLKGWGLKLNRKRICSLLFAYGCGCDLTSSLNVLFSFLPQSNGF